MPAALDVFIPRADVRERHETLVRAPAELVLEVARGFDLQSVPLVRAIFWLRKTFMGSKSAPRDRPKGLEAELLGLGWKCLVDRPGELFIAGAACQPWLADVVFRPVPPEAFVDFGVPDHVKIAWTLEARRVGPALTQFASETRAVSTDDQARAKFRKYWRLARVGIVAIRRLLLPALRREAERRWKSMSASAP